MAPLTLGFATTERAKMSVSYWQDTAGQRSSHAVDVLIIGAGLAGLSTAYWLNKKEPGLKIAIVDKGPIGNGASGRNAGFITCGSTEHFSRMTSAYGEDKASEIWKFTEDNHKLVVSEFGKDKLTEFCEYRSLGSWTLAATQNEIDVIGETVDKLAKKGINVKWYPEKHVKEKMLCEGLFGGAYYGDDGEIHPMKFLNYLRAHCPNTQVFQNSEVFAIEEQEAGNLKVRCRLLDFHTPAIVLATNAWSGQLDNFFADKIAPTRGQIIVTEPIAPFLEPSYCSFVLDYFRQLVDGRVLIGGFRNADVEREVGFSDEVNPIINEKLEGFLHKHFPILRGKKIDYRWSGVMGFAADGYPMVGSLPHNPSIYYAVGFTAHGLGFTFKIGQVLADLMLEGKDPGIFSGRRFGR